MWIPHGYCIGKPTNSTELREHLDRNTMEQSYPPLLHCEHDSPAWNSDGLLGCDGLFDLVEFALNPLACMFLLAKPYELRDST